MRTIYVDAASRCHVTDDGTMTAIETDFFDGKCDAFVQGHCYEVSENVVCIYPYADFAALDSAQRAYEQQKIADYEALIDSLYEEVTA